MQTSARKIEKTEQGEADLKNKRILLKPKKPNGFEESEGINQKPKKADNDEEDEEDNDFKKENIKKKFGENGNVKFTDEEYEKVKAYFPKDYTERIQALDDYIQSKGKKYKDFFATLRTWARKEGYKPPTNETKPTEEVKAIDTSQLTPEEYGELLKGEKTVQELIQEGKIYV